MKAKDLAALAALGIAGKFAYDKFGNKTAPGKASPVYDYDSPAQKEQAVYDYDTPAQKEQVVYDYDTPVQKQKTAPVYDNDAPAQKQKAALIYDNDARPVASNGFKKVKTAAAATTAKRPIGENAAGSLFTRRDAVEAAPAQMPDASRVTPYNSDIMYNNTVKSDPNVAHDDEMNRLARTRATRQGAVVAQSPNDQAQARILRQGATTAQATPYNSDIMYNTTVPFDPKTQDRQNRIFNDEGDFSDVSAQAQERMLRQGSVIPHTMNRLAEKRNQRAGVIPTQTPNAQAQARILRQGAPVARAKGGVVKMAKGGLASSKMSKPSGASRGDGIAQRGRTRGTLR
jgi:hypothetical protein